MPDIQPTTSTSETPQHSPAVHEARPVEVTTIKHGSVIATPVRPEGQETVTVRSSTPPVERSFTAHQKQMLANLDKHGDVRGETPEPAKPEPAKPEPEVAKTETPAPEPAKPEPPKADPDLAARLERMTEANKRLVAQLEQHKTAPVEPDDRMKTLDEIERGLTTDSMGSLRRLVALNAGIKDPASPDVDALMAGIYAEWTAHELKMDMSPADRALLESKRNRILLERDRRDRDAGVKAEEAKKAAAAEVERHAAVGRQLNEHLETSKHGEKYPLLMKHAQRVDHMSPGDLIFAAIRRGIAAGEFTKDTPDETLINHYSKEIETHYQALRDDLAGAPTSTAAPTQATVVATDKQADATNQGVRTITNASASVAPPTTPVPATTSPAPSEKPTPKKWRNEDERRAHLAKHYFGSD